MLAEEVENLAEKMAMEEWGSTLSQLPRATAEKYKALAWGTLKEKEGHGDK